MAFIFLLWVIWQTPAQDAADYELGRIFGQWVGLILGLVVGGGLVWWIGSRLFGKKK
jgi:hypothetical protein